MSSKKILISILSTTILLCSQSAIAQTTDTSFDNCFDYYKFQSVQVSVGTERDDYKAGDTINFVGMLENENLYPVVDGNVFVRISETNENYITEGHYIVDEFIAKYGVILDASSTQPVSFSWKAPKELKSGSYRADYFFLVGKQFNLGGLSFTNEIIVGFDNFNISSDEEGSVYLDRAGTKVNGEKYNQIGNWPVVEEGSKVDISQVLKNTTNKDQKVEVLYDLFYWDSLNPGGLISSKKENVDVIKGKTKILSYEISKVEQSVYYLRITAKTDGAIRSILNVRISSDLESPRINYFGVSSFPIEKGDSVKIFSCFHNTSNLNTEGKVVLSAKDMDGKEIAKIEYNGTIPSAVSAKATDLLASKDLTYLKLDQTLYDKAGKLISQKSEIYDCNTLKSKKCEDITKFDFGIIIAALAVLFLVLSLVFIKRNKNLSIIFLAITIIFAVLGAMLRYTKDVSAAKTFDGQEKTKSVTKSANYDWRTSSTPIRSGAIGTISLTHTVNLVGNSKLYVGVSASNTVSFTREKECSFTRTGSVWDTPYCGSALTLDDSVSEHNGSISFYHDTINENLTSSNSSVLTCNKNTMTCTAVAPGTARVTVGISAVDMEARGYIDTDGGSICHNGSFGGSACSGTLKNGNYKMTLYDTVNKVNISSVRLGGYYPSWTITVVDPEIPPTQEEECLNGIDDDGDGLIDENDPGCTIGGGGTGDGINENSADPEEDEITPAACGSLASTTAYNNVDFWPTEDFCMSGVLYPEPNDYPEFPVNGGSITWHCYKEGALVGGIVECYAEKPGPAVLGPASCQISQTNSPLLSDGTIYSNRSAVASSLANYDGYTFTWIDVTNQSSQPTLGTGRSINIIFTSIGTKKIKLVITNPEDPEDLGAICTTSVKVIQKPSDVIEQ